jgi:glycosyltransferase involved in cell wall biosynthesis
MVNKYKCSIFCSFYKGEKFVRGYVEDILNQTIFDNIEFILLDCASPENEKEILYPLSEKYPNILYIRLDSDPGLYAAWNIAIGYCSSSIIGNWNIDDRKNSDSIEILLNEFNNDPDLDMTYGATYISRTPNEKFEQNIKNEIYPCYKHSLTNLLQHNSPHCMPLWKKNIHEKIGYFNTEYDTVSDAEMWLKLAVHGGKIKECNNIVGLYYWNPEGRSTDINLMEKNSVEAHNMKIKIMQLIEIQK